MNPDFHAEFRWPWLQGEAHAMRASETESLLPVSGPATGRPLAPLLNEPHGDIVPKSYGLMMFAISADRPFHAIWMPMQSRMKATTRRIPWAVEGGMALVILGA